MLQIVVGHVYTKKEFVVDLKFQLSRMALNLCLKPTSKSVARSPWGKGSGTGIPPKPLLYHRTLARGS